MGSEAEHALFSEFEFMILIDYIEKIVSPWTIRRLTEGPKVSYRGKVSKAYITSLVNRNGMPIRGLPNHGLTLHYGFIRAL